MSATPLRPKLRCLGGEAPPAEILRDAEHALGHPPRIRQRFWDILGPCLAEPLPEEIEADLDRLCAEHSLANAISRHVRRTPKQPTTVNSNPGREAEVAAIRAWTRAHGPC